ncbi:SAM-dependent methyltransferase [Sporolactobacillus sp. THM7-4]|nr:SAM-dependent methyltransferase [Sporolactobacillus sp. THM7-4]
MTSIHLSKRLRAVASFIPKQARIADIGSDHAHLPCVAIREGIVIRAVAGEVKEGPFRQAVSNVVEQKMTDAVSVRMGDGLDVIERGEVDTIVIAGMGGELITEILERGLQKLTDENILILQPNIREPRCRLWLASRGWRITNEAIIEEEGHFYEIIRAERERSGPYLLTEEEQLMGPVLIRNQTAVFKKKWTTRKNRLENILRSLENTEDTPSIRKKRADCGRKLEMIHRVLE